MTCPSRRHFAFTAGVLAAAAVAGGCSSGATVAAHQQLQLGLTEYRIDPQSIRASAGQLTIVVSNYGRRTHNLVLSNGAKKFGGTEPLWPGQKSTLTVTLPAGKYLMASTILNDRSLGQYGTLVVR